MAWQVRLVKKYGYGLKLKQNGKSYHLMLNCKSQTSNSYNTIYPLYFTVTNSAWDIACHTCHSCMWVFLDDCHLHNSKSFHLNHDG